MINYIKGKLTAKLDGMIVVEMGGMGFEISIPANSNIYMESEGAEVKVFTYLHVREDNMSLFGFTDSQALDLFKKLITVNSVGAKAALAILSSMPLADVRNAIIYEDVDLLTRANGIGKKTAQKIVLDLKDKIGLGVSNNVSSSQMGGSSQNPCKIELAQENGKSLAVEALINLGYSRSEAMAAMIGIKDEELTVEEYIKLALKKI